MGTLLYRDFHRSEDRAGPDLAGEFISSREPINVCVKRTHSDLHIAGAGPSLCDVYGKGGKQGGKRGGLRAAESEDEEE